MGLNILRVAPDWQHPVDAQGHYRPLLQDYAGAREEFAESVEELGRAAATKDWGGPLRARDYMPVWDMDEATHWQLYEDVSEGTPLSPPLPSKRTLALWLEEHEVVWHDQTWTAAQWYATIEGCIEDVLASGIDLGYLEDDDEGEPLVATEAMAP